MPGLVRCFIRQGVTGVSVDSGDSHTLRKAQVPTFRGAFPYSQATARDKRKRDLVCTRPCHLCEGRGRSKWKTADRPCQPMASSAPSTTAMSSKCPKIMPQPFASRAVPPAHLSNLFCCFANAGVGGSRLQSPPRWFRAWSGGRGQHAQRASYRPAFEHFSSGCWNLRSPTT